MNPSYMRIKLSSNEAIRRFKKWINLPEHETPKNISSGSLIEEACNKDGEWKGIAVFAYENGGWTIFEDVTGHLTSFTAIQWLDMAQKNELVFAGYNDSVPFGQLYVIIENKIKREFLDDRQNPLENINKGKIMSEKDAPISTWEDVEIYIDEDELFSSESGLLIIFRKPGSQAGV